VSPAGNPPCPSSRSLPPCCEGDFNNSMQTDALRGADSRTPQS
jgi:hypothetical protein